MELKTYEKYRDSEIDWVGKIPNEWRGYKLKHVVDEFVSGGTPTSTEEIFWTENNDGIPWIAISDMTKNYLIDNTRKQITLKGLASKNLRILKKGTLIYSIFASLGKVSELNMDSTTNQAILGLLQNKKITKDYLKYYLNDLEKVVIALSNANTQNNLNTDIVKNTAVFIPESIEEQAQITKYLNKKISNIDLLIKKNKKLIELNKIKRVVLIENAINNTSLPRIRLKFITNTFNRSIKRENNKFYEPLGLYNWGRGIFHKKKTEGCELGDSDFYYVKDGDLIISGQFAWEGAVSLASKNEDGCVVSHRFPVIRGKKNILNTEYLWAFFTTKAGHFILNENSIGSAGRNRPLNLDKLMREKIVLPKIEIQNKIVKFVNKERSIKLSIEKSISLLEEYKKSIIHNVITGKVDVRGIKL